MKRPGRVLVVDDEPFYRETLTEELSAEGWTVEAVASSRDALDSIAREPPSVVLVDQKLKGPKGPDSGLDLVAEIRRVLPEARVIMITGYASPETVAHAYRAGAYDFVEKTESFMALLRIKVRNAMEGVRAQWLDSIAIGGASAVCAGLWADAQSESDSARKGRLLEDLFEALLVQVPGFVVAARQKSADEEFDLVVRNESSNLIWSKESPYILVECKNWSSKVGPTEFDRFENKIRRRYDRARLGFIVASNGFTKGFDSTRLADRTGSRLIVPIGRDDLDALVRAPNTNDALKALHQRAVVADPS